MNVTKHVISRNFYKQIFYNQYNVFGDDKINMTIMRFY
jgi:hypothetical protein